MSSQVTWTIRPVPAPVPDPKSPWWHAEAVCPHAITQYQLVGNAALVTNPSTIQGLLFAHRVASRCACPPGEVVLKSKEAAGGWS